MITSYPTQTTHKHKLSQHCFTAFKEALAISAMAFYDINEQLLPTNFVLYNITSTLHTDYLANYQALDPLQPNHCIKIAKPVIPLQLAFNQTPHHCQITYQQFLAHHQIKDIVEIIIVNPEGKPKVGISLLRQNQLNTFSIDELNTLSAMKTLIQQISTDYIILNSPSPKLTDKEQEVILLLKKGLTNKELAQYLTIEVSTIKTHLNNLFRKFAVKNRGELISLLYSG